LVENLLLLTAAGGYLSLWILVGGNYLLASRFDNPALASVLLLLVPYPLLMLPASAVNACLMARDRTEEVAVFSVGSRVVLLVFMLLPLLIWATPSAVIVGMVIATALTTAVALRLMFRACPTGPWRPTWPSTKAQIAFAVPLGLAGLVTMVSQQLDQVLVSARCRPEVFAVYSVGAMEIPLVSIVAGSIASVVIIDYARFYREARTGEIVSLIHSAMTKSSLLFFPVMVFLLCIAPDLMSFLFGEQYRDSSAPFRVFLLLLPVRAVTFGAVLQATGKSRQILVSSILTLAANAVFGWLAIGWIGPVGTAVASVASIYLILVPCYMWVLCSTLHVSARRLFPWMELLKILAVTVLPGIATYAGLMFLPGPHILRLAVAGIVDGGLLVTIIQWVGLIRIRDLFEMAKAQVKARWPSTL
jgi:O-antigen/teichoic acid export membrane protein